MRIEVLKPGALSLVQDLGSPSALDQGVPERGAMDPLALHWANRRVGNPPDAAGLELTLQGPTLRLEPADEGEGLWMVLVGASFELFLDDKPLAMAQPFRLLPGQSLEIARCARGARAWLAIRGGIAVPRVLGSRSTHLRSGWGGFCGRALARGDRLPIGDASSLEPGVPPPDTPSV